MSQLAPVGIMDQLSISEEEKRQNDLVTIEIERITALLGETSSRPKTLIELKEFLNTQGRHVWGVHLGNSTRITHTCGRCDKCESEGACKDNT